MAEKFLEPQNPLKKIDTETGDINYIYPQTTAKQVIMDDDGTRLNTILNEMSNATTTAQTTANNAMPKTGGDFEGTVNVPTPLVIKGGDYPGIDFYNNNIGKNLGTLNIAKNERRFYAKQYNADMDSASSRYGEVYYLPQPSAGLTAEKWYPILTGKNPVTITNGGTGATDAATALTNLGAMAKSEGYLLEGGVELISNADLNNYVYIGNYYCPSTATSKTMSNLPNKAAFTLKVEDATGNSVKANGTWQYVRQVWRAYDDDYGEYRRIATTSDGGATWTWDSWVKTITELGGNFIGTTQARSDTRTITYSPGELVNTSIRDSSGNAVSTRFLLMYRK